MITKQEILDKLNEIFVDEKGIAVTINDKFVDAQLDSLGTMVALLLIDDEYRIFDGKNPETALHELDIPNLTIRELIHKCKSSTIATTTEQP